MSYRSRGTRTRALAGVVAALLALGLMPLFSGVANAQTARDTDDACPVDAPDAFTDDEGNVHEANINCLAFWDIVSGTSATTYSPRTGTTRAQMATIIAEMIDTAAEGGGAALPANPPNAFGDDDNSVHHNNINRLAAADVVNGTSATTFTPQALVTRGQMASFIAQGLDYINDGNVDGDFPPAATQDHFTDDEASVHESNINRLAEQDIVVGTGGSASGFQAADHNGTFTPRGMVFRDQTASFGAQAADFAAEAGFWPPVPGGAAQATATDAPELVSVAQESFSGTTLIVRYRFDEALSSAGTASGYKLYPFNSTGAPELGDVAALVAGDATTVRVQFNGISQGQHALLTTATVVAGTVNDVTGTLNPEGDAPYQSSTAQASGSTAAPDLVGVSGFTAEPGVSPANTRVTFEFDENAWNIASMGYHLVHTDGVNETTCTFLSGNGTTSHVVECPNRSAGVLHSTTNVARGYVDAGTVGDTAGGANPNVLQAADVAGTSETPDLVSIALDPLNNRVTYTFDEIVRLSDDSDQATGGVVASFTAYTSTMQVISAATAAVSSADRRVVIAEFADITDAHVGAQALEGAVEEREGAFRANRDDEARRSPGTSTTVAAGRTNAPDLTGVSRATASTTNIQGQATAFDVVYTFDENVTACGAATLFRIYLQNGTQIQGSSIVACGANTALGTGANQVRVRFDVTPPSTQPASAVSGGVATGAVSDADGPNPEGYEVMPAAS